MINEIKTKEALIKLIAEEFGYETADLYKLYFLKKTTKEALQITEGLLEEILGKKKAVRLLDSLKF